MCGNLAKVKVWVEVPQSSMSRAVVVIEIYHAFFVNDLASFLNLVFRYN